MNSYRIALIPGDGVGTEISDEAEKVLAATLSAGETRTKDMGGTSSTIDMGSAVVAAMRASA